MRDLQCVETLISEVDIGGVLGREAPQNTFYININVSKFQKTCKRRIALSFDLLVFVHWNLKIDWAPNLSATLVCHVELDIRQDLETEKINGI